MALILGDRAFTFDQLRRAAVGVSLRLAEGGVEPGDIVMLFGRHSIEAVAAVLGCMHRGAVAAPLPPTYDETQLSALIVQTHAAALLGFGGERELATCGRVAAQVPLFLAIEPALIDRLAVDDSSGRHVSAARHADDPALVIHSSGTTSAPKGIVHSSNTLRYATESVCKRWELTADDVYLVVFEFGIVGALVFGYFPPLFNGATAVLVDRWDAADALRLIDAHRCTYVIVTPPHCADLIESLSGSDVRLPSMRVLAAPALTRERRMEMRAAFGLPPLAVYGLSEVPGHAAHGLAEPEEKMLLTEGRPYDGTEIRIVDDNENAVEPDTVGSVVVNGPSRFLGFLGNDELTRESLADWGGYRTGDLGYLDEDGHFVFVARQKDIIRRGGVTIVPSEVQPVILRHPSVREVEIVPLPDDQLGERACAAIIPVAGETPPSLEELRRFLDQERVAESAWPDSVEVFEEFPRTPTLRVVKAAVVTQIFERSR